MSVYFTPGPSQLNPHIEEFMADALADGVMSMSHRGAGFSRLYQDVDAKLKELLGVPRDYSVFFVGSATEAMERTLQGLATESSQHFVNGAFGEKWWKIAGQVGLAATRVDVTAAAGAKHEYEIAAGADIICLTHNETSTGVTMPDNILRKIASDACARGKFVAVDIVSSAPFVALPWEFIDVAFFSVQKNFGLPAGLGVMLVGPRALEGAERKLEQGRTIGSYHSLVSLAKSAAKFQTPATPNVLGIYLLGRVLDGFLENIGELRQKATARARGLYDTINRSDALSASVEDADWRSLTVIVAEVAGGNAALCDYLANQGLMVGKGYQGPSALSHVRIANFPAISDEDFTRLLIALEKYLCYSSKVEITPK